MTIDEVFHIIDGAFRTFQQEGVLDSLLVEQQQYPTPKELKAAIIQTEEGLHDSVLSACETFAAQNTWPKVLSKQQLLLVFARLKEAKDFLRTCKIAQPSPIQFAPEASRKDILEFLLRDYWLFVGHERWLGRMCRYL